MATGDSSDIVLRLQRLIPSAWFQNGASPLRDALLAGCANVLAFIFSILAYIRLQTRIGTASDGFLDMIAGDYLGASLIRGPGQADAAFRAAIISRILGAKATRKAVSDVVLRITGRAPIIFEPADPIDTGAYGVSTSGYGMAGAYGSLVLPFQAFVSAFRPPGAGVPNVAGYGISTAGYGIAAQGEYISLSMVQGVADADIYAAIDSVRPAGSIIWARIS